MKLSILKNTLFFVISIVLQACKKNDSFPDPNRCGDVSVIVHEIHDHDLLFGPNAFQLSEGDISSSIILPTGDTAWLVNNAMLNTLTGKVFLHNCMVLKNGASVSVKYNGSGSLFKSLIAEPSADSWYTINSGIFYNGQYQLIISAWQKTGAGAFDFAVTGTQVIEVDVHNFTIKNTKIITAGQDVLFGSAIFENGGYTYIYGTKNMGFTKDAYVARTTTASLLQSWSFFDGYNWKSDVTDARPFLNNVSDVYSVFKQNGMFYLATQASGFGQEVSIYFSGNPESGWRFSKILYCRSGVYDHLIAVNSKMHFINNAGNLIYSYSLIDDNLQNAQPYRPAFIEIENWQ